MERTSVRHRSPLSIPLLTSLAWASPAPSQVPDTTALAEHAIDWVHLLRDGRFDSAAARVAPAAAAALGPAQLREVWAQLAGQLGELESLAPGTVEEAQGYRIADLAAGFATSPVTLRVVLDPEMRVAGFFVREAVPAWEPPPYADSTSFHEVEVTVGEPPWELPGTLTLPAGEGPFPVAVLVHGSGPQDRDETVGPNKPLKDLAWGLASSGVAALRYDKRTAVHGAAMGERVGLAEEVVEDALAALALARTRPRVDSTRAVVIGHSLGGMLAPEIAREDGGLAGVVLLAAPSRPFLVVLRSQLDYVRSLSPAGARASHDSILAQLDRYEAGALELDATLLGAPISYWDEVVALDPVGTLADLEVPALILQGGRDYQSTTDDLARWRSELSGRPSVTTRVYPALNHFLAEGAGRATPTEYTSRAGHVAAEVVHDVAAWILELPGVARVPIDPTGGGEGAEPGTGG